MSSPVPNYVQAAFAGATDSSDALDRAWIGLLAEMIECGDCGEARYQGSEACDAHGLWPPTTEFFCQDMVDMLMEMDFIDRLPALEKIEATLTRKPKAGSEVRP